ncbi:MAG: class I SAM-dependent methyltransferase [archaeon]
MKKLKLKKIKCEICGSQDYTLYRKNSGLAMVQCKTCKLVYVNPQPTLSYLKDFYNKGEYREERWDFIPSYIQLITDGHRKVADYLIGKTKTKKPQMLDIGSGLTDQFHYLQKKNWNVMGTELSKTFVDAYIQRGFTIKYGDVLKMHFKEKKFDVIVMMAVLEHLTNPKKYLLECHRLLKDEGVLIFKIPNLHYTLMNSTKLPLSEQMHLFHFTPTTIKMLLEKCGFEIIKNEPLLECGSENKLKHAVMVAWDKVSWVIYKATGMHTNLQMTVYAKKSKRNCHGKHR